MSQESLVSLLSEYLAVYRVFEGEIQNLMLEDPETHVRWVNPQDLSEPMSDMQAELKL